MTYLAMQCFALVLGVVLGYPFGRALKEIVDDSDRR